MVQSIEDIKMMNRLDVDQRKIQLYSEHQSQKRPGDRFRECVSVMQSHLFQRYSADFNKRFIKTNQFN
jgi:hypothetical protein